MKIKLILISFLLLSVCSLLPAPCVFAEIPHLINYQGRLTDSGGVPLNGSHALTFRIFDAETAGNLLWEEVQSGVVINKGIFSVLLGSVTNLNLAFDKPYFLEIKVGNEVMSPRQRIATAAYAMRAENAEKIKASSADTAPGPLNAKIKNSIVIDNNQLQLSGDSASPGNDKVYGTNSSGVRGWYSSNSYNCIAGDYLIASGDTERVNSVDNSGWIKMKEFTTIRGGTYRIKFSAKNSGAGGVTRARIYKNGSPVGTERATSSGAYTEYSEDVAGWTAGDLMQIYIKNDGLESAYVKNFRIYINFAGSVTMD